jgi:hypothetical protein
MLWKLYFGHVGAWVTLFVLCMIYRALVGTKNKITLDLGTLVLSFLIAIFSTMAHYNLFF